MRTNAISKLFLVVVLGQLLVSPLPPCHGRGDPFLKCWQRCMKHCNAGADICVGMCGDQCQSSSAFKDQFGRRTSRPI
ncbi:unnamed protein product [Linum tenue]|uniref:Uncharacterized protein n=1 Tax=Linum tenue TaxID=586396 RepID=A0AAV0IM98_9ROSI|nr:unnamed protein product [Linum tenue]